MHKIPEWFLRTPGGKKMVEDAQESTHADRQELVSQIIKAKAAIDAASPGLLSTFEKTALRVERAREALENAKVAHAEAAQARYGALARFEWNIEQAEIKLRESADPRIAQTVRDLRDAIETLRLGFMKWQRQGADPAAEQLRLRGLVADAEAMLLRADRNGPEQLSAIRESAGLQPLPEWLAA